MTVHDFATDVVMRPVGWDQRGFASAGPPYCGSFASTLSRAGRCGEAGVVPANRVICANLVGATPTALRGRAKLPGVQGTPTQSRGRGTQCMTLGQTICSQSFRPRTPGPSHACR